MKLVLFDCDGTLVDSAASIHACMARTFVDAGLQPPELEETRSIIGLSLPLAIGRLLNDGDTGRVDGLTAGYKQHFANSRSTSELNEPLFDGIAELVDVLRSRRTVLSGVVTGKSRRGLDLVLESHGLNRYFQCVRTADDCPSKPNPAMVLECCGEVGIDPADTIVIGDTSFDMQMAKTAGAEAIGVCWGYHEQAVLVDAGADAVLGKPADLLAFLK